MSAGLLSADTADVSYEAVLSDAFSVVHLDNGEYSFFLDGSRNMTIDEIVAMDPSLWTRRQGRTHFRRSEEQLWIKAEVDSRTEVQIYLTEHFGVDLFDVWIVDIPGKKPEYAGRSGWKPGGLAEGRTARAARVGFSSVSLGLSSRSPMTVYIRTTSDFAASPHFIIMAEEAYHRAVGRSSLAQGISIGFSLVMIIFALSVFASAPRTEFFIFFLLIAATSLNVLYFSGVIPLLLFQNVPLVSEYTRLLAPTLFFALCIRFFQSILDLSQHPRFGRMLRLLEFSLYVVITTVLFVPVWVGFIIDSIAVFLSMLVILALLVAAAVLGLTVSKLLLGAWSILLLSGLLLMVDYAGVTLFIDAIYNNNHLLTIALLIQSALFGTTIVAQSEYSRTNEVIRRIKAEVRERKALEHLVVGDRMEGLASMVSVISHEMGGPLGSARLLGSEIGDRAEALAADLGKGPGDPVELQAFLAFSSDSGRLISETVGNADIIMEGFKTIAADEATVQIREVDLGEYIERLARVLRPRVSRTPHSLIVNTVPGLTVRTIPGYISQIVTNLVTNAIHHAFQDGQEGTIILSADVGEGAAAVITVSDDGSGVPEDKIERIFEMFYTTAADTVGTGLGLAVSRHLAEAELNGRLNVESQDGGGSTFRLTLGNLARENLN